MRITSKQNGIYKAHVNAFKIDKFDSDKPIELEQLELGVTSKLIWDIIFGKYVSITSQIMASTGTFKHLSNKAQVDLRRGFKIELNKLNIK